MININKFTQGIKLSGLPSNNELMPSSLPWNDEKLLDDCIPLLV